MLIAGVRIGTMWQRLTPREVPNRAYEEFLGDQSPETPDIQVDIYPFPVGPLNPSGGTKIFDSQQSWSLFHDGTKYLLSLRPPFNNQEPVWLARFDSTVTQVEVFLNTPEGIRPCDPVRYPLDQLLLVYYLARRSGLLLHAAGAAFGGMGMVFPGRSRAGKSTLSRQLQSDQRIKLLSDDRVIVRKIDGGFRAFGTPWPGEAGIAKNSSAPLSSLLFLNHSSENRIEPISLQKALEKLLPIASIPWYEKRLLPELLDTCEELLKQVPAYDLHFRPDSSVVDLLNDFSSPQKPA